MKLILVTNIMCDTYFCDVYFLQLPVISVLHQNKQCLVNFRARCSFHVHYTTIRRQHYELIEDCAQMNTLKRSTLNLIGCTCFANYMQCNCHTINRSSWSFNARLGRSLQVIIEHRECRCAYSSITYLVIDLLGRGSRFQYV